MIVERIAGALKHPWLETQPGPQGISSSEKAERWDTLRMRLLETEPTNIRRVKHNTTVYPWNLCLVLLGCLFKLLGCLFTLNGRGKSYSEYQWLSFPASCTLNIEHWLSYLLEIFGSHKTTRHGCTKKSFILGVHTVGNSPINWTI